MLFGVDSIVEPNVKLHNGYTMYDWISRKNLYPKFWGRPISGDNKTNYDEIDFLHKKGCKIALLYTEATEESMCRSYGVDDAINAVEAVEKLGVDKNCGIAIFVKINSDCQLWENWIIGFAKTVYNLGFIPGFIANTDSSINSDFDRCFSRFAEIAPELAEKCLIWATEPKCEQPEIFMPYCPSVMMPTQISIWNTDTKKYGDFDISESWIRDESILKYLW